MRIGIVTRSVGFNDGQGRVNREIAAEALRQGHQVRLFSESVDADIARSGAETDLLPPPKLLPSRLLRDQIFAWRTARRLDGARGGCDALLANGFATWGAADVNSVHFVHRAWLRSPAHPWRHRRDPRTLYMKLYSGLNTRLERGAFRRSAAVVAVSDKVRGELIEAGVPAARITTILNGVDCDEFHPGPARRDRFGLPDRVTLALFAGDLRTPRKNLDTVLRALAEVPDLHLAVAGRHEATEWPAMAAALGVADRVHFLGFQRDMPELMRACDLFVFPSRYEACSLVILEALASGLPVITAATAGGAELVSPAVGVVLADAEDAAALAAALRDTAGNAPRLHAMAEAARHLATEHSWSAMARRYIALLEEARAKSRIADA